jgi:signal transduction histidine kinase
MLRTRPARSATVWMQLLLVGALACVVLILAEAYRAARSSRGVAEHALRDYADFAAWSYRQQLTTRMRDAVDELLGAVNHGDGLHMPVQIPGAHALGHFIYTDPECNCHRTQRGPLPVRFLGFTLGTDTLEVGVNLAPKGLRGWLVDPPMMMDGMTHVVPAVERSPDATWMNGLLTGLARQPRSDWGYSVAVVHDDSGPRFFASRSMPTVRGDTIVYAVEYPPRAIDSLLDAVLASGDLLPPTLVAGRRNRDILDVTVSDANDAPLFTTRPDIRWELDAKTQVPASYGGLQIRAQLRPELADALLIGGIPQSRVPLLLLLLALAAGLSVLAAAQIRREVRFAAERANFVANVSHELRTPLAQVRLVLDTLRLGRGGSEQIRNEALGVADREVLRLQHLVEGVLRFARGPRRDDLPRVPTDVSREARAVAAEFQPLAAPRGVRVVVTGDDNLTIPLQTGALRQVLLNLLDNAVKYGRDGGTVTIDARRTTTGGVMLAVSDKGPGVPRADRERIWRSFERGADARQRGAGGSGIGLTIVREIAEEHGGSARVGDAPGGGARFVVELPGGTS